MPRSSPARLWIGTSGYVYRHWRHGVFYPASLPQNQELEYYGQRFDTVELNNPFYRLPTEQMFLDWHDRVPHRFRFAVKASRFITHLKKLKDCAELLGLFLSRAALLKKKLGPILFQFPRTWPVNLGRLQSFLELLPRGEFAFEFRHPSWLADPVYAALRPAKAALCLPVGPGIPAPPVVTTAPFAYLRMHAGSEPGGGFTEAELAHWAAQVHDLAPQLTRIYVYFNNDMHGFAIRNAQRLQALLKVE